VSITAPPEHVLTRSHARTCVATLHRCMQAAHDSVFCQAAFVSTIEDTTLPPLSSLSHGQHVVCACVYLLAWRGSPALARSHAQPTYVSLVWPRTRTNARHTASHAHVQCSQSHKQHVVFGSLKVSCSATQSPPSPCTLSALATLVILRHSHSLPLRRCGRSVAILHSLCFKLLHSHSLPCAPTKQP
jgi:hypothetical protein